MYIKCEGKITIINKFNHLIKYSVWESLVYLRLHSSSCKWVLSPPWAYGIVSLAAHGGGYTGLMPNLKPNQIIIFLLGAGGSGIEPFPTQSWRVWSTAGLYPARLGNEMIRSWRGEGAKERGSRKWANALIALWCRTIIYRRRFILCSFLQGSSVHWEVYLLDRPALTPAGMCMYVRSRLNFI